MGFCEARARAAKVVLLDVRDAMTSWSRWPRAFSSMSRLTAIVRGQNCGHKGRRERGDGPGKCSVALTDDAGEEVLTLHANESMSECQASWVLVGGGGSVLNDCMPPGSAPCGKPFGMSTFMAILLLVWMENRKPSTNSACWTPAPPVRLTVRVAPWPYWTKMLAVSSIFRPRRMYSPSSEVILMILVLFSVLGSAYQCSGL